jgi:hypothetical protein
MPIIISTPLVVMSISSTIRYIDWTNADTSGALRTVAWADGGANDICPAGFSVPTEAELTADTIGATTTNITNIDTANNCSALECYILSAGNAIYTKCLILNTTNTKGKTIYPKSQTIAI